MRKYNRIYKVLLEDENDFVGMVAYALYKRNKIAYIEEFKKRNEGKLPTEDDLETFHDNSLLETSIHGYLNLAEKKITDFIAGLYSHEIEQIKNEYNEKIAKTQHDFIEELNEIRKVRAPGFFRGVLQSVLGAVGYSLLIAFIILILWSSRFGCKHVIESISGYKLVEKAHNNTTESFGTNIQQPENKNSAHQSSENLSGDKPDNQ